MPVLNKDDTDVNRLAAIAWLWRRPVKAVGVVSTVIITGLGVKYLMERMSADRGESRNGSGASNGSGDETMQITDNGQGLPPGNYSRDTLPPPRPEVQAILDRAAERGKALRGSRDRTDSSKLARARDGVTVGKKRIVLADKGKRKLKLT